MVKSKAQGSLSTVRNRRLLIAEVVEAKNIVACDSKKTSSDSYVQFCLLDLGDREIKAESFATNIVKGTLNPVFHQQFTLGKYYYVLLTQRIFFLIPFEFR